MLAREASLENEENGRKQQMKFLAKAAIAAAMFMAAGPALAADPMATAYGNTVVITYGDGTTVKLFIDEGGSYTGESPMGAS